MSHRVRELRDRAERDQVAAALAALEPRSTQLLGELAYDPHHVRLFVAERDGRRGGVLAVFRICWDLWEAAVVLEDEDAAPALAGAVDGSRARAMHGSSADVLPLVPHLRRHRTTNRMLGVSVPAPLPDPTVDRYSVHPGARVATEADVGVAAELWDGFELDRIPTRVQLRRRLRRLIRAGMPVFLLEEEGRLIGGTRVGPVTHRYAVSTDTTLVPEARGQSYAWVLTTLAYEWCREHGVGFHGTVAQTNPIPIESFEPMVDLFGGRIDEWCYVGLAATTRFPGQRYLRSIWWRVGGRRHRRPAIRVREDGA